MLTLGSLFDGSGGFPLAGTLCGLTPLWASEIEKFPIAVTSKRFPGMKHLGDVTKINGSEIEPVEVITFGSPCTNLSVAGKHNGFNVTFICFGDDDEAEEPHFCETIQATDKTKYLYEMDCPVCGEKLKATNESALFFNAIRVINEMRQKTNGRYPTFIVWENVPGAFSSNKGDDFRTVLEEICRVTGDTASIPVPYKRKWLNAGEIVGDTYSVAWRVFDAQYWGVPQRRRRIYLVADFGGQRAGEILFEREGLSRHFTESGKTGEGAAGGIENGFGETGVGYWRPGIQCLRAEGENRPSRPSNVIVQNTAGFNGHKSVTGSIQYAEESAPTLEANMPSNVIYPDIARTLTARGDSNPCADRGINIIAIEHHPQDSRVKLDESGICQTLAERMGTGGGNVPLVMAVHQNQQGEVRAGEVANTLNTKSNASGRNAPLVYTCRIDQTGSNGLGVGENISQTLDGSNGQAVATFQQVTGTLSPGAHPGSYNGQDAINDMLIANSYIVRRLTPTECARLQGFPDWWCADIPHSDSAEYKMWGNGIALPCAVFVLEGVAGALRKKEALPS